MISSRLLALAVVVAAAPAPAAAAQTVQATTGFQDGFFIQTGDGDNRLVFGLVAQVDGRFSTDDPAAITNTFVLRKARPTLSGRVARHFDFKVMPDFGNGNATIMDAYFDVRFSPKIRIRAGKDKTPVGYELLVGDAFLLFPERSLASSLVPNRDIGIQLQGDLGPRFYYAGGVFNGVADATSSSADVDENDGKDLAGRVVIQPFRTDSAAGAITGLGLQIGGSAGQQLGTLPAFRTSAGQTYFSFVTDATAAGARRRVTPSLFYYYKSFGAFAEYVRSTQEVGRASAIARITNTAWDVSASYLLTGEAASTGVTRPQQIFDPAAGSWGALQLVARYSELVLDDVLFVSGLAAPGSAAGARSFTAGVNWFPAAAVKYYVNFERTEFDAAAATRPVEHVIIFRVQLAI
jgi:phosphate-selective porin OprO/OprP